MRRQPEQHRPRWQRPQQAGDDLSRPQPPEVRSAGDRELSRTFMANTTNTLFGQSMHLALIQAVHDCKTEEDLRRICISWAETVA